MMLEKAACDRNVWTGKKLIVGIITLAEYPLQRRSSNDLNCNGERMPLLGFLGEVLPGSPFGSSRRSGCLPVASNLRIMKRGGPPHYLHCVHYINEWSAAPEIR